MNFVIGYPTIWLWPIFKLLGPVFLSQKAVGSSLAVDLVNNIASSGSECLVVISDDIAKNEFLTDAANSSKISLTLYDSQISLPNLSASGKECLYHLLIFDNVASTLQFLNRCNIFIGKNLKINLIFKLISDLSDIWMQWRIHII